MSTLEIEDPWNTPSVMAMTPPLTKLKINKNILPQGSSELQTIIAEMYEEMEVERRIKLFEYENVEPKRLKQSPNGKVMSRIPTRIDSKIKQVGTKKKTVMINEDFL